MTSGETTAWRGLIMRTEEYVWGAPVALGLLVLPMLA